MCKLARDHNVDHEIFKENIANGCLDTDPAYGAYFDLLYANMTCNVSIAASSDLACAVIEAHRTDYLL